MSKIAVYTGLWRDYSRDGVRQLTLTLPTTWSAYLISAMTLLVSLAGTRLWAIVSYSIHQLRVKEKKRHDPTHAQLQALLRNSISPTSVITDAYFLLCAWSGTASRIHLRLVPIMSLAMLCLALFTLAGTFISGVATDKSENIVVLASPEACGAWDFNWTAINASYSSSYESLRVVSRDSMDARAYAKLFYSDEDSIAIPRSQFPMTNLPYSTESKPCPFKGTDRCISNDTSSSNKAMLWDSGVLDSHTHLGINAPVGDRVGIRKALTCSPIDVSDLTSVSQNETNGFVGLNFTDLVNGEFSYYVPARLDDTYASGYYASCFYWNALSKSESWAAQPFDRDDADLSICYVVQNSVGYSEPVYDPLFLANGSRALKMSDGSKSYLPNNYFNTMGCIEQVQFCNSQRNACTNLTHTSEAVGQLEDLDLNINQVTLVNRTAMLLGLNNIARLGVGTLGAGGLQANEQTFGGIYSTPLPPNQWQNEVRLWFETGLALLQAHSLRFLTRIDLSSQDSYGRYLIFTPLDDIPEGPRHDTAKNVLP